MKSTARRKSIGLNQGGEFAKNLNVFIGGGQVSGNVTATQNGSVNLNLTSATVDTKSLGLDGVQAVNATGRDLGAGSATSVQNIVNDTTNLASICNNTTTLSFTGPGFSDTSGNNTIKVSVNLTGVTDTGTLVTAINQAIQKPETAPPSKPPRSRTLTSPRRSPPRVQQCPAVDLQLRYHGVSGSGRRQSVHGSVGQFCLGSGRQLSHRHRGSEPGVCGSGGE